MGTEHNYIREAPTTLKFGTLAIEDGAELEFLTSLLPRIQLVYLL